MSNIILASRVSGCHLDTKTLKIHPPSRTPIYVMNLFKYQFQGYAFHPDAILMALFMETMSYCHKTILVYGCNLGLLFSPLIDRTLNYVPTAYFGQLVSKSWLRPWCPKQAETSWSTKQILSQVLIIVI